MSRTCPNCGSDGMSVFYEINRVPVHSVLLLPTREEAVNYPKGDIALGFCDTCGFISNVAFDPSLHEYSSRYEATHAFSPTFNAFSQRLADHLIKRHNLRGKDIIEIGCGQGEFLALLCERGDNRGIGFDPAYIPERSSASTDRIRFIADFYSEQYTHYQADFVCCKMTLEHIDRTAEFVHMVRRSVGDRPETVIFFQVPNISRILRDMAFWDIYYEHCSYFSMGSLGRVFRQNGFDVIDLATDYDDQYLMIEARPMRNGTPSAPLPQEHDLDDLRHDVAAFADQIPAELKAWQNVVRHIRQQGKRAVIWGGGSKGVSFLTTLHIEDDIPYAVDINPYKHGMFMAGTGQEIVGPEFLRDYRPHVVIVMNPIYCSEIQQELDRMGVDAELLPV